MVASARPWAGLSLESEQEFVLTIARAFALAETPEDTLTALTRLVPRISSWDLVDTLLTIHRCTAISYSVLGDPLLKESGIVPEPFFTDKRDRCSSSFARVVMEPVVLHRALDAFARADVPALAIKGLAVGTWLYGDAALREHDDIDFLVPAAMGDAANTVLIDLGYTSGYRPPLYPGESPATASYSSPDAGLSIDLSFDPLQVFWQSPEERQDSFDGWWARRQELTIGGRRVATPGAEDQLLQLARHLQFHGYFRVNWWIDLMLLMRRFGADLNWTLVAHEAEKHSIAGGLTRTLELASGVYGLRVPDAAWRYVHASRTVRTLHRRIWPDTLAVPRERLTRAHEGTPIAPRFLSPGGVHPVAGLGLFVLDRRRKKHLTYLVQRVFPPAAWLRSAYGNGRYPALWRTHWRGLRDLRSRVRQRTR